MKPFIGFIIGLAIGGAAGTGYLYPQVQNALNKVSLAEVNLDTIKKEAASVKATLETAAKDAKDKLILLQTSKQSDEQAIKTLKEQSTAAMAAHKLEVASVKTALESATKEVNDKLAQLQSAKQSDEQAIKSLKNQLAEAVAARVAAEAAKDAAVKALADAKKAAP